MLTNDEYVEGVYVRFREVSGGWHKYSLVTVMSAGATQYTVSSLRKFTKYEFFLTPFFKSVEGQPSNSKFVQTLEDGKKDNYNELIITQEKLIPIKIYINKCCSNLNIC